MEEYCLVSSEKLISNTGEEVASRPSSSRLQDLRHAVLEIAFTFIKQNITPDETKAIMSYLADCSDEFQVVQILQVRLQSNSSQSN
jgi:hypothetical protein